MAALSLLLHLVPRCLGARNPQLWEFDNQTRPRPGWQGLRMTAARRRKRMHSLPSTTASKIRSVSDTTKDLGSARPSGSDSGYRPILRSNHDPGLF